MKKILVLTNPDDTHAMMVAAAMERKGHRAVLWHGTDFPTRQNGSVEASNGEGFHWRVDGPELDLDDAAFDVVWNRRATTPVLPEGMHPGDRTVAERECERLVHSLWCLTAPQTVWINPIAARDRCRLKPLQLRAALEAGLRIPATLCSNDPRRIRRFLRRCAEGAGAVYKPLYPVQWQLDDGVAALYTSAVTEEDLPSDEVLRLTPGIFQERITKAEELRVTFFGDHAVAVRVAPRPGVEGDLDWRVAGMHLEITPRRLPEETLDRCRKLMRGLGILFGCFDFIVTPGGEHVFLEVNEMGQFLWVEEMNPEVRLLDPFCEFLLEGKRDFRWRPRGEIVTYEQFIEETARRFEVHSPRLHVPRPNRLIVPDEDRREAEGVDAEPGQELISGTASGTGIDPVRNRSKNGRLACSRSAHP